MKPTGASCYKTKNGLTAAYVNDHAGMHYIQVYNIPYTDEDKLLYDSKKIKDARFYIEDSGWLSKHRFSDKYGYVEPIEIMPEGTPIEKMIEYVCENY